MHNIVIHVENLSKEYRLGTIGYGTLRHDLQSWWARLRGKEDPNARIGVSANGQSNNDGKFWALKDISFEVEQGEVLGIIGRNGAGKSTLLKILSRITPPTKGTVKIKGRVASLLEVGTGFHPELTGGENVYLNGTILGMKKREIDAKFDEIVKFAEVEKFIDTPVKRYSSGMYVRLAFAVAAHLEPEILIVDEVLAVGDVAFQKKCLGKMGEVSKEGRTVLFVSHNMTAIRALCSRAILLRQGTLVTDETAAEVVSKYISDIKESNLVREWCDETTAPHNGSVVLEKVAVCDDNGKQLTEINTDTPFNIEIDYKVKTTNASVGLTVIFYDNENNCIFGTINNHEPNWYGKPMPAGAYKSICKIPKNFFNNGWFNLSINLFGKDFSDAVMIHEILKLEIIDGAGVRGDYYGGYDGVVRPSFEWITVRNRDVVI